ncbi:MAG: Gfo/Idh/MocA family oxidoreductase [Cellulomonadaceae bacterium]|nr:Gfo/Idh/MocA family oxidoreductase [Cellulomonadaceae bacterium]
MTVTIGVLGAARIVQQALLRPAAAVHGIEVVAVAARDGQRARAFADEHGVARAFGSYDDLLADPDIDAVYVPTPPSLHAPWTLAAIRAGKHVLCEKPFTVDATEAAAVHEAARGSGLVVMEAFHSAHHPLWATLATMLAEGRIGHLQHAVASFCFPIEPRTDLRWQADLGGGALMDLGVYPLRFLTTVLGGGEGQVVSARAVVDQGVDAAMTIEMLAGGVPVTVEASMIEQDDQRARATFVGDEGTLTVHSPYSPQWGATLTWSRPGHEPVVEIPDRSSSYEHMLRTFAASVAGGSDPVTGTAQALAAMRLVDAAYAAAGLPRHSDLAGSTTRAGS